MQPTSPAYRLPLSKVLLGSVAVPWVQRGRLLQLLMYPALLFLIARVAPSLLPASASGSQIVGGLVVAAYGAAFTIFAVRCHQLMLLSDGGGARPAPIGWSGTESRFALMLVAVVGTAIVAKVAVALPQLYFTDRIDDAGWAAVGWLATPAHAIAAYVAGRLSLALPAQALSRPVSLAWAWRASRGNGWRLAIVVALWPWLLNGAVEMLYRQDATFAEWALLAMLAVVLVVFQVSALSLAYRELAARLPDDATASSARSALPVAIATVVIGFLIFGGLPLYFTTDAEDCKVNTLVRDPSADGRLEVQAQFVSCADAQPRLMLVLQEGRHGDVLHSIQSAELTEATWRQFVAWRWTGDHQLDVLVPDPSNTTGRAVRGIEVRFRAARADLPPQTR